MSPVEKFSLFYQELENLDTSGLTDVYSEDIEFIDPITTHNGINSVKNYFDRLLQGAKSCSFTIHHLRHCGENNYTAEWRMAFVSKALKTDDPIVVDGITVLKVNEIHVTYHRDYYDMGQLAYEHVPLLGYFVKRVKEKLK